MLLEATGLVPRPDSRMLAIRKGIVYKSNLSPRRGPRIESGLIESIRVLS